MRSAMTCAFVDRARGAIEFEDRQLTGDIMGTIVKNFASRTLGAFARNDPKACSTKLLLPLLSLALAGCAIHPVQRDVTGLHTVQIVDRIRCESRLAIQDKAVAMLRYHGERTNNPRSIRIAEGLAQRRARTWNINTVLLDRDEKAFYDKYIATGIAYEFTFDISEVNKIDPTANPFRLIGGGIVGINIGFSNDLTRESTRRFALTETFGEILKNEKIQCQDDYLAPNFEYPMAGTIGMRELIDTFIDLNQDKDLAGLDDKPRVFADTLMFATAISGSIQPRVEIAAVGTRWGLASPTNVNALASRNDIHKLVVGLSMGSPGKTGAPGAALAPPFAAGAARIPTAKTANEVKALEAIQQQHLYDFYDRFGALLR
jgi:hypothetical protein